MSEEDAALPIPAAAEQLGIHEKRLRRLLTRPEHKGRTQTQTRSTRTGERSMSVLPPDLLRDLAARLQMERNGDNGDEDKDTDNRPEVSPSTGTRTETRQVVLSAFYERLLSEKEKRIEELMAALEHERTQSKSLVDALTREQALRALPAPVETPTQDAPAAAPLPETPKRKWWQFFRD